MLQTIHDKISGWVAYFLLGAIALVFILWGINWSTGAPTYAAKVDGVEVSPNEIREAYQRRLADYEKMSQGPIDDAQRTAIKQQVLDDYVTTEALLARLQGLGYRVSDSELLGAMAQIPAFQVDGKLDMPHAVAVLKSQGRSIPEVEASIRRQVQLGQLESALATSSFTTDTEAKQLEALTRQQRELAWVILPAAHFSAMVNPEDTAIKRYYDEHKTAYMTPESVDLHYVELSLADMTGRVNVTDAQLKAFYDEQRAKSPESFSQPEQRRASHILIQVNDPKEDSTAKATAEKIYARAKAGEDFVKLAKQYSQDTGSAQQGGDLGWSDRKAWVAPFADAAFSMQVDEIRGPVKSQFGYHIIRLEGIRPASERTFEQSKSDLEAQYRRNEAEKLFNSAQDQLADAALQNATDLDAVAHKAGLVVKEIPVYTRVEGGALSNAPKVADAAFNADVLDGRLSPIIEVDKGRGVVLKATDHKLPQQKPLDSVRAEVIAAVKKQRGAELAAQAAQDDLARLQAGETLDQIAKSIGVTVQAPRFIGRSEAAVPAEIRTAAFESPRPAGKPLFNSAHLFNGDSAVLAMSAVRMDPSAAGHDADMKRQYAERLAQTEAVSYAVAAKADSKIELNPQAID